MSVTDNPLQLAVLFAGLGVVGWGFGMSAALARCSFLSLIPGRRARLVAVAVALVLALGSTYAYALMLDVTGFIDYCDPVYGIVKSC